jgi:hypothetical protein
LVICAAALAVPSAALAHPPCKGADLHLTDHKRERNSDSTTWVLAFTNRDHQCVLDGYPPTELLNREDQSVFPGLVTHKHHILFGEVLLDHNKVAYVTFSLFHGAACHAPSHNIYSVEFLRTRALRLKLGKTSMCYAQVYPFREHP